MPFVANLQRHYEDNGISALDFRCKKYSDCKRDCPTFVEPCEGFVGTDCGRRLRASFFISLDQGWADANPNKRTIESQRQLEECSLGPKNRHWYRTNEMAWTILRG